MDTIQKSLQSFVFPFALYAGLTRAFIGIIPKILGFSPFLFILTFLLCFILEIGFIIYITKQYKTLNNNLLSLQDGLKIGVIIMMVIGFIYAISSFIYDTYIDPDYLINTTLSIVEKYSPNQLETTKTQLEEGVKNPSILGVFKVIINFIIIGFLISVVTTNFLKTKTEN